MTNISKTIADKQLKELGVVEDKPVFYATCPLTTLNLCVDTGLYHVHGCHLAIE